MHAPTEPGALASWIRELAAKGELYRFYKSPEFLECRRQVIEHQHNECADCLDAGRYHPIQQVHHLMPVKEHPEMALTVRGSDGTWLMVGLCKRCHDVREGRAAGCTARPAVTAERWD